MGAKFEKLGKLIDRIESLEAGLSIPMPATFHVEQFKKILPEIVDQLKSFYVESTGDNPWEC